MSFSSILLEAFTDPTGGARSFPAAYDGRVRRYQAPSEAYERLLAGSRPSQSTPERCAGWLIAEEDGSPLFIAPSMLAAIALMRDTLPVDAVPPDTWDVLVTAVVTLSQGVDLEPPSAQSNRSPIRRRLRSQSSVASSPKRPRRDPTSTSAPAQDPEPADAPPVEHISKVTNHNRRAEREREKKQVQGAQRRKVRSGLLEPAESAGAEEKSAYSAIKTEDYAQIAWVIKQPVGKDSDFYHEMASPYATASDMLTKARAVGNPSTWQNVTVFLQTWRDRGTPIPEHTSASTSTALSTQVTVAPPRALDRAFQHAWHVSRVCELRVKVVAIEYRWAMAFLGRAYARNAAQLGLDRTGVGQAKSQAIDALRKLIEPTSAPEGRKAFVRQLNMASRWYQLAEKLGWGILCLIPENVTNTWVRNCTSDAWPLWLQLIQRVNPDACVASKALDAWIGKDGLDGGAIQGQEKLYIEENGGTHEVEEVVDSEEEKSSDEEPLQRRSSSRRLRQPTLLELIKPQ